MKISIAIALVCAILATTVRGGTFSQETGVERVSLIELFTSEGCSSCPPAEEWLGQLKKQTNLWREFVPVAFHVDYWDQLGWTDRFDRKEFTQRQENYANAWHSASIYTPEFVLDGKEWLGWRAAKISKPVGKPGVLRVRETQPGQFQVEFEPADKTQKNWDLHFAVLGMGVTTNVKAGENSGKTLVRDFVTLDLQEKPAASGGAGFTVKRPDKSIAPGCAIAVWVSREGSQAPEQALGGVWGE